MNLNVNVSLKNFTLAQVAISSFILLLGLASYLFTHFTGHGSLLGLIRLLDVGDEQSIPTYFSVLNLLLASILLLIIYIYERGNQIKGALFWLLLSLVFFYLSVDESASIHENFVEVNTFLVHKGFISQVLDTHQWLPFGIFFLVLFAIVFIPLFKHIDKGTLRKFFIAGFVFVSGAVGLEYLGAVMLKTGFVESRSDLIFAIRRLCEEGLEMYGIVIFNCVLYQEILKRNISISFNNKIH